MAPHQVQSRYNFMRGSDLDEIRVYDRMLDAAGGAPRSPPCRARPGPPADPAGDALLGSTASAGTPLRRRCWRTRSPPSARSSSPMQKDPEGMDVEGRGRHRRDDHPAGVYNRPRNSPAATIDFELTLTETSMSEGGGDLRR